MERLKVAIADKILEASSGDELLMKQRLTRIQRFSDFAEACKSLMVKYPQIEAELLEMVHDNDFDTARASRRVDSIINKLQNEEAAPPVPSEQPIITTQPTTEPILTEIPESVISDEPLMTTQMENDSDEPEAAETIVFTPFGEESELDEESIKRERQKKVFGIVWRVLAAVAVIVVIFIVVKFVINYWKYVVLAVVILGVAFFLWQYLKKRRTTE